MYGFFIRKLFEEEKGVIHYKFLESVDKKYLLYFPNLYSFPSSKENYLQLRATADI